MTLQERIFTTSAPASVILIRLVVGGVFLSEGIQKFLYPGENGVGRFVKIGIPSPEVMAPFIGVVEIVCGALVLLGLLTRLAAVPLIIVMLVAILSTKIPILLGQGFWGLSLRNLPTMVFGEWLTRRGRTSRCCSVRFSCSSLAPELGLWMRNSATELAGKSDRECELRNLWRHGIACFTETTGPENAVNSSRGQSARCL